jgi:hypothetical protein
MLLLEADKLLCTSWEHVLAHAHEQSEPPLKVAAAVESSIGLDTVGEGAIASSNDARG